MTAAPIDDDDAIHWAIIDAFQAGERDGWTLRLEYVDSQYGECAWWVNPDLDKWIISHFENGKPGLMTGDGYDSIRIVGTLALDDPAQCEWDGCVIEERQVTSINFADRSVEVVSCPDHLQSFLKAAGR